MLHKKLCALLLAATPFLGGKELPGAHWSFLTYMQADNDIISQVAHNCKDMQKVGSTNEINILLQLQRPSEKVSSRYKILQNAIVEKNSTKYEALGNFEDAIINSMEWVAGDFPARHYALVLWNYSNNGADRSSFISQSPNSWLMPPGMQRSFRQSNAMFRDHIEQYMLDTASLGNACRRIKTSIKKNIDVLGIDACLMGLFEIAYEVKDAVDFLIVSQHAKPTTGWSYAGVLSTLIGIPTISTEEFGTAITRTYADLYGHGQHATPTYTLATVNLSKIPAAVEAFNKVIGTLKQLQSLDSAASAASIKAARANTVAFSVPDYIDLIDFFDNLDTEFSSIATAPRKDKKVENPYKSLFNKTIKELSLATTEAKEKISQAITAAALGPSFEGKAHGLSVYFPADCRFDNDYRSTRFAQETEWVTCLKALRKEPIE